MWRGSSRAENSPYHFDSQPGSAPVHIHAPPAAFNQIRMGEASGTEGLLAEIAYSVNPDDYGNSFRNHLMLRGLEMDFVTFRIGRLA